MKDKKNIKILIICAIIIVLVIGLTIGITYAFMKPAEESNSITDVTLSSCARVTLTDTGSINLSNSYPMSRNRALQTTPYKLTVTGKCNDGAGYNLLLGTLNTNTLDASNIRFILTNTGTKTVVKEGIVGSQTDVKSLFSDAEITEFNTGVSGNVNHIYLLYNEAISSSGSSYDLYLYIDESVTGDISTTETFSAGIAVKAYNSGE